MNVNKLGEIIRLFPLLIYKTKIGLIEDERSVLVKEVYAQESKSKNLTYTNETSAWTGDTQGFEFLFSNKKFEKLFNLISLNIKKYTESLGIDNDKIDFYYQRAWATISRNGEWIETHKHAQSHISFAYYLKKDSNDGSLSFHNESAQNEIAPEMFHSSPRDSTKKNFFKPSLDNAQVVSVHPQVDEIYIFPSKCVHSTTINKTKNERISISADISVVAKNSENIEHLLTPVNKWTKF